MTANAKSRFRKLLELRNRKRRARSSRQTTKSRLLGERLEDRHLLAGTTIITHGFLAAESSILAQNDEPAWLRELAVDIARKAGDGQSNRVAQYRLVVEEEVVGSPDVSSWEFDTSGNFNPAIPNAPFNDANLDHSYNGEAVIVLDWSDVAFIGETRTGTVARLATEFLEFGLGELGTKLLESDIHLVGHSRGGSLVGALANELGERGIVVDHVTYLDAHPIAGVPPLVLHDYGNLNLTVTENVAFADSYYREGGIPTPNGEPVPGATNFRLYDSILEDSGYGGAFGPHSDTHLWYHATVLENPTTYVSDAPQPSNPDWFGDARFNVSFGNPTPDVNGHQMRVDATGYAYSRIAGGSRNDPHVNTGLHHQIPGGAGERHAVSIASGVNAWPNVFGIELSDDRVDQGDSVSANFLWQDRSSDAGIAYYVDTNKNPRDAGSFDHLVASPTLVSSSPNSFSNATLQFETNSLPPDEYWLLGVISDTAGHKRYSYSSEPITIEDPTPPVVSLLDFSRDFNNPTAVNSATINVSATANDAESGVDPNGFEFHTQKFDFQQNNWVDFTSHLPGIADQTLGVFDEGLYAISVTATNGSGVQADGPIGYFRVHFNNTNQLPSIDTFTASQLTAVAGTTVDLVATGITDDGSIFHVNLFRDIDGDQRITGADVPLATEVQVVNGGFSFAVNTTGYADGSHVFMLEAVDNLGAKSHRPAIASVNIHSVNQPPVLGAFEITPDPVTVGSTLTLRVSGISDPDGLVSHARFYFDSNANATLDAGDEAIGVDRTIRNGVASINIPATFPRGTRFFFADVVDTGGATSLHLADSTNITGGLGDGNPNLHWTSLDQHSLQPGDDLTIRWGATDRIGVSHIGLYLYQGPGISDDFKVDTSPYVQGGHPDGRLSANGFELPNTGLFTWRVPENLPEADDYRVKVVVWDTDDLTDYKFTNYFSVGEEAARLVSLSASPRTVIAGSESLVTLTARVDNVGSAGPVQFVRDNDRSGSVTTGDNILGVAQAVDDLAIFTDSTSDLPFGSFQYLARLRLPDFTWAEQRVTSINVTQPSNQPPTLAGINANPSSAEIGTEITITGTGISDDRGVRRFQVIWDADGSGDASSGDRVLGEDETISAGQATVSFNSGILDVGSQSIIGRVQDTDGAWTDWRSVTVTLNAPAGSNPTIGGLEAADSFVQHALLMTITAVNVTNADAVRFYHDSNANGTLDASDQLLREDTDGNNGWWWRGTGQNEGFPIGDNRFFAVAVGAFGQVTTPVSTIVTTYPIDVTPPTASTNAPDVTNAGGTEYSFQVTYNDNISMNVNSFDDLNVEVVGPGGFDENGIFVTVDNVTNGPQRTATYRITPPGGTWDGFDNGAYRIIARNGRIDDTNGNSVAAGEIGSFLVDVPFNDSTAPIVTLENVSPDADAPTGVVRSDFTVQISASDPESGIQDETMELFLSSYDGMNWSGWQSQGISSTGYFTLEDLSDGLYSVYGAVQNGDDTTGSSPRGFFVVDTVIPQSVVFQKMTLDTGLSDSDLITADTNPTFVWTEPLDEGSGVAGYWYSVDDPTPESGGTFTKSLEASPLIGTSGQHRLTVRPVDLAGNLGIPTNLDFLIDNERPIISSSSPSSGDELGGGPQSLILHFSEDMDTSNIPLDTVSLSGSGLGDAEIISATWIDADSARFDFSGQWSTGLVTFQIVDSQLRDIAGNGLEDLSDSGFVISPGLEAEIQISNSLGDTIDAGTYLADLGDIEPTDPSPIVNFLVTNLGTATLTLVPPIVPDGFIVVDDLVASLAPGESDTLSISADTLIAGPKSGNLLIESNDSDESPFGIQLAANVLQSPVEFNWVNTTVSPGYSVAHDVATDSEGNILVTGNFQGATDFDPGSGQTIRTSNDNSRDMFLAKYDPQGGLIWVNTFGSTSSSDSSQALAVDNAGNVYVTGSFRGTVNFGGTTRTAVRNGDIFAAKYTASGNLSYVFTAGGTSTDYGRGIAVDSNGNAYVSGNFDDSITIGGQTLNAAFTDAYLLKLNTNGSVSWVRHFGGSHNDWAFDVAVDNENNVYTTGYFASTADFNKTGSAVNRNASGDDAFVTKHSNNGVLQWVKNFGDQARAIEANSDGNVVVAGKFQSDFDFDPSFPSSNLTSEGGFDGFAIQLDRNGGFVWLNQIGGTGSVEPLGLSIDADQNAYLTGSFGGALRPDLLDDHIFSSLGSTDAFVSRIGTDGRDDWTRTFGSNSSDSGYGISATTDTVLLSGRYTDGTDFDPSADTAIGTGNGFFLLNLRQSSLNQAPEIQSIDDQVVNEGDLFSLTPVVTNPDSGETLLFSLDPGAPIGLSIAAQSGLMQWTPSESQGPGSFPITVRVTDDGSPAFSATETFVIEVLESNAAPSIDPIENQTADRGNTISVTATATDSDIPAQSLRYQVVGDVPTGLNLDTFSGQITWAIPPDQPLGAQRISVQVSDDATNSMSALTTFTVNVNNALPTLGAIEDQSTTRDSRIDIPISVTDFETAVSEMLFSATSSDPSIIGESGIMFEVVNESLSLSLIPNAGPVGSANVTVSATDADGGVVSTSFQLTVTDDNTPPTIQIPGSVVVHRNTQSELITINVGDAETESDRLSVSAVSSNQSVVADQSISITGTGSQRTLQFFTESASVGTTEIIVSVRDEHDGVTQATMTVSVPASVTNTRTNEGFGSIESAIEAAETNDILYLADGVYPETIVVDKPLTLRAQNVGRAIIDAGGAVNSTAVEISANSHFEGIWVRNAHRGFNNQSSATFTCHRCIVSNVIDAFAINQSANRVGNAIITQSVVMDVSVAFGINDGDTIEVSNTIIDNAAIAYSNQNGNGITPRHNVLHDVDTRAHFGPTPGPIADDLNEIQGNPVFIDREAGDLELGTGSPAIDAGLDLGESFEGAAPDIGAFEKSADIPIIAIIDDGDLGFETVGPWTNVANYGYELDAKAITPNLSGTATWTISGLSAGHYDVSITWLNGGDRASNVPYVIRDGVGGSIIGTVNVNQKIRPSGNVIDGRPFLSLGTFIISSDTLVVELDNAGTDGAVIADAVRIETMTPIPDTPEITVLQSGVIVDDGSSFTFAPVVVGQTRSETFTVRNDGTADIILQPIHLTGSVFSLGSPNFTAGQILAPGSEVDFTINVDTSVAGSFQGTIAFDSNDGDESPFDIALQAEVLVSAPSVVIIDDGDPGFVTSGPWNNVAGYGYLQDAKAIAPNVSGTATWTFSGLAAGDYDLSLTWLNGSDRANNVEYTVRDGVGGNVLSIVQINQRVAPNGLVIEGRPFSPMGSVTITGDTLVVEVSNSGANGAVIADAIRVESLIPTPDTPEIAVTDGALTILDGGNVDLGSAEQGTPAFSKTFTVENVGTADLTLEPLSVSGPGFSLQSPNFTSGQILAPSSSVTFTIALDTSSIGTITGNVSFGNSDADENPFNFDVSGTVTPAQPPGVRIIDNGDSGFSSTGSWANVPGYGYGDDALAGNGVNGIETAQWVFDGLTAGTYDVATTWLRGSDRADNVTYTIRDGVGGAILGQVTVNQKLNPIGNTYGGRPFQLLNQFTITGDTLVVELSTAGTTQAVLADAVRIELN